MNGFVRFPCGALGTHSPDESARIDVCHRARPDREDPRMSRARHDAGDGVQTLSKCGQAVASATCCTLSAGGHARYDCQGWSTSRAERRVSPAYTTLDNNPKKRG